MLHWFHNGCTLFHIVIDLARITSGCSPVRWRSCWICSLASNEQKKGNGIHSFSSFWEHTVMDVWMMIPGGLNHLNISAHWEYILVTVDPQCRLRKFGMWLDLCAKFSLFPCVGRRTSSQEEEEEWIWQTEADSRAAQLQTIWLLIWIIFFPP